MTLTVESHSDLGAVGREAWLRLELAAPGATVFQSWWWLTAWWPIWGEGRALVLTVHEEGRLVGAGAFYIAANGRVGFIGEEHADYGNVLAVDDRDVVVAAIVAGLMERRSAWRRLALLDVRLDTPLAQALRAAGCGESAPVPCPRVRFADRPVAELLAKESLRRHERKLAQAGPVEFLHLDAAAEIAPWIAPFFAQHLERWALTQTPSLFVRPRNREFYSELAATAEPGGSLLFSVVQVAGAPVAMHFGLRSQDEILWYKPTYDPRLASSGPGEVLLAELLRRADREGCAGIDFTRGDEAFKLRFATELREVASFEAWPDSVSRGLAHLGRGLKAGAVSTLDRLGMKQQVSTWSRKGGRAATIWRAQGAAAVIGRARSAWAEPRASTLEVYVSPTTAAPAAAPPEGFSFRYCATIDELLAICEPADSEYHDVLGYARRRFATKDRVAAGVVDGNLIAWGWTTQAVPLPVTELDAQLHFGAGTTLCYDFRTIASARGRGYYTALLTALRLDDPAAALVVYARTDHAVSRAGIESAGFVRVGTFLREGGKPVFHILPGRTPPALTLEARARGEG